MSAIGPWSKRTVIRHWRLGLSVSFLAVLAGMLTAWTVWAIETHSEQVDQKLDWAVEIPGEHPSKQLDQEIKTPPTPAYAIEYEASTLSGGPSAAAECVLSDQGHYDDYACLFVSTKATDPVKLVSITQELLNDPDSGSDVAHYIVSVARVEFYRSEQAWKAGNTQAVSYCFGSKDLAVDALRGHLDELELVGKSAGCYVIVYDGYGPDL